MKSMALQKKKASGAFGYLFMFMTVMIVVIITLYMAQVSKLMTHQHHVDDSLADAVLQLKKYTEKKLLEHAVHDRFYI